MSADVLASAVESLVAGVTVYKGKVPSSPKFPYLLVSTNFPSISERALSREGLTHTLRVRVTGVGFDNSGVRWALQHAVDGLEGARPDVPGWLVGRVESVPNDQPFMVDRDVNVTGFGNPVYGVMDWILTASKLPA